MNVLGNFAGGTDVARLQSVLDATKETEIYIDDTSIIIFDFFRNIAPDSTGTRRPDEKIGSGFNYCY
jgi:hypothetical protein